MASWLARLLAGTPGAEREVVERYTDRLLAVAARRLPARLRPRVDAEDIVQSVYRSFFRRIGTREFRFDESHDLWRLLVTITYYKVSNTVKFHERQQRDVRRETALPDATAAVDDRAVGAEDVEVLYDCLARLLKVLPETSRAIVLRRLDGERIEDIAGNVHRSRRTVLRVLANVQSLAEQLLEGPA